MASTKRPLPWIVRTLGPLAAVLVLGGVGATVWYRQTVLGDDPRFEREALLAVVAEETPVYYRDGVTRLGVFFGDEHRTYLPWEALPEAWVVSIVASEDQRFWSHPGLDAWGIARAMVQNLLAGEVVSGASTLTQQTVKNLFYRPDSSVRAKLDEAVNALKIEARYPKSEILEFYANQFHVTGNGRGLGVAARYLFDKDLQEAAEDPSQRLRLEEAAFLAGFVKGPSNYDPFVGDAERRARAIERGHARARYVLQRIVESDPEALAGFAPGDPQAVARVREMQQLARMLLEGGFELSFRKGTFRFPSDTVLDEVRRRLRRPPLADVLARHGGEDLERAGLKVVTTLDVKAQQGAVYALRHHLTEAGTLVEGLSLDAYRSEDPAPSYDPDRVPEPRTLRRAVVEGPAKDGEGRRVLDLDLGGHGCRVDRDGLVRVAAAIARGRSGRLWDKVGTADVDAVVEELKPGTVVLASVRTVGEAGAVCDLEAGTTLQGAVVVTEQGAIRAMVGGRDNRDYNRATALRQLGSTWKTVVLSAALELGWSSLDPLDNRRAVFPYSATAYAPSPDHDSVDVSSLGWAGVRSENLATVWLLYHLLDRLDIAQVATLAAEHGLARQEGESDADWRRRLSKEGLDLSGGAVEEARLLAARDEVAAGLRAGGAHPEDLMGLMSLQHGRPLARAGGLPDEPWAEAWADRTLWDRVLVKRDACARSWAAVADALDLGMAVPTTYPPLAFQRRPDGTLDVACDHVPEGYGPFDAAWTTPRALPPIPGFEDEGAPEPRFEEDSPLRLSPVAEVAMPGLHLGTIDAVAQAVARRRLEVDTLGDEPPDVLDDTVLYALQDMRVRLALEHVASLAARYGVRTELERVLSMPLGAKEITLEEGAVLYDGLTTGRSWAFPGLEKGTPPLDVPSPKDPALLVLEIRDVDDNVLYRARGEPEQTGDPEVAAGVVGILEGVVAHGTGRRAFGAVRVGGQPLDLLGKTGTTNAYRNAAFLGRVPAWTDAGALGEGYVVGAYVGFDDNRPMRNRSIKLAGASGALPVWIDVAAGLADAGLLGPEDGLREGALQTLVPELRVVAVDPEAGLPVEPEEDAEAASLRVLDARGARLARAVGDAP